MTEIKEATQFYRAEDYHQQVPVNVCTAVLLSVFIVSKTFLFLFCSLFGGYTRGSVSVGRILLSDVVARVLSFCPKLGIATAGWYFYTCGVHAVVASGARVLASCDTPEETSVANATDSSWHCSHAPCFCWRYCTALVFFISPRFSIGGGALTSCTGYCEKYLHSLGRLSARQSNG